MNAGSQPPKQSESDARRRSLPPRVQMMVDAGRLREQPMSQENIAAIWTKAVESAHDAELPGMSVDGSLRAAYDAGHLAALAYLGAHGLRPGGGQGHHEMAFAGAAAFGDIALADLVPDSEELRGLRAGSMYDPVLATEHDRHRALDWGRRTLPAIRAGLIALDAGLRKML